MLINQVLAVFLFFSASLALLQALGEMLVQNRTARNHLGALVYLCLAVSLLHAGYFLLWQGSWIFFYQTQVPFTYMLGPAVYQFVLISLGFQQSYKQRWWLQYLPALIVSAIMLPDYLEPAAIRSQRLADDFKFFWNSPGNRIFALGLLHTFVYFLLLSWQLLSFARNPAVRRRSAVRIFAIIALFAIALNIAALVTLSSGFFQYVRWILAGMALVVPGLYLLGRRHPDFLYGLTEIVKREKYNQSQLRGVPIETIRARLNHLMQVEQVFLTEDLSLNALAALLEVTPHQLSEIFNVHLEQNFASYVNSFRIEYACNLIKAESERTILSIAYDSGFSSRSAFHNAFQRLMGMSPSQYRKQSRKPSRI